MPKRCFNYENAFERCSVNRRERVRSICNSAINPEATTSLNFIIHMYVDLRFP